MRTMILAVAVSTGALGCVGVGASRARVPLKAQYDTSTRQAALERAIAYLSERNYPIRVVNEQVGLINTEWVSIGTLPCGLFGVAKKEAREQIAITLGSSGHAIVNVNRQILDCYNYSYGWTDSDPDGAEAEQALILDALLGRQGAQPAAARSR